MEHVLYLFGAFLVKSFVRFISQNMLRSYAILQMILPQLIKKTYIPCGKTPVFYICCSRFASCLFCLFYYEFFVFAIILIIYSSLQDKVNICKYPSQLTLDFDRWSNFSSHRLCFASLFIARSYVSYFVYHVHLTRCEISGKIL